MSENKINQLQLFSLGACYLMGTILSSVFINVVAANDSWFIGLLGAVCFLPVVFIYLYLTKKYPKMNLFDINEAVLGPIAGRIASALYLLFFLTVCALSMMEAGNFVSNFIMPDTPLLMVEAFMMAACVYCVKKGILPIARVSTIFGAMSVLILLINFILSFQNADLSNLLPLFNHKPLDYIQSTHIALSIPHGESVFIMMLLPDVSEKVSIKKAYLSILAFTVIVMVFVHLREIMSLGLMVSFAQLPSYEAVRMIDVANTIARTESLFALLLTSLVFFKVILTLYVSARGIMQLFRLESIRHVLIMPAVFLAVYSIQIFESPSSEIYWGINVIPIVWGVFTFAMPVITFVCSLIRGAASPRPRGLRSPAA